MRQVRRKPALRRQRAERRGRAAEWLCLWHLRLRGWHILARGWRCPAGEIDILARRGKVLAVIEVKSRGELAVAAAALAPRQRRLFAPAIRPRQSRPPIRPDVGGATAPAASLARRLARRRLENLTVLEVGGYGGPLRVGRNPRLSDNEPESRFSWGPSMSCFRPIIGVVSILALPVILG